MDSSHLSAICISLICLLDINPNYVSPHAGMGPHMREGVKEQDRHIEPKSCKLKL